MTEMRYQLIIFINSVNQLSNLFLIKRVYNLTPYLSNLVFDFHKLSEYLSILRLVSDLIMLCMLLVFVAAEIEVHIH